MPDTEYIPAKEDLVSNNHGENSDDMEALKAFLLDISCLDPLSEWTDRFNLFDVLKISHYEIRHSNLLAWLLSPNETHGIGSIFLEGFIKLVLHNTQGNVDVFRVLLMDFQTITVFREWYNIDILAVSETEQFVLCIENKYGSKEHDDQLNRYRETVLRSFPGYTHLFVFLSPDGAESSSPEYWCPISYGEVLSVINSISAKAAIRPEVEMLINQYAESVRREIMGEEELIKICQEIYSKHQRALDLLFDHRPDKMSDIAEVFMKWAQKKTEEGVLRVDSDHSNKIDTRIKTVRMDRILPDVSDVDYLINGWGQNRYFYEIHQYNNDQFRIHLVVNISNKNEPSQSICDTLDDVYKKTPYRNASTQIRTYFATEKSKVGDEIDEASVFKALDHLWNEIVEQEERIIAACQNKSDKSFPSQG